jgi:hypothetical protein
MGFSPSRPRRNRRDGNRSKSHSDFERKFLLLHGRVTFARTALQLFSVKNINVPARVFDDTFVLQRLRLKGHGGASNSQHLCNQILRQWQGENGEALRRSKIKR